MDLYQTQITSLERKLIEMEAAKEAQISKLRNQVALTTQRDAVKENLEMLRIRKDAKVSEIKKYRSLLIIPSRTNCDLIPPLRARCVSR